MTEPGSGITPSSGTQRPKILHYVLQEVIGKGGFSTVFRARDERLDREVALKLLSREASLDSDFTERFFREAQAAARIVSPHVVILFEVGACQDQLFLAFELVQSGDLKSRLQRSPSPSVSEALRILGHCLIGLEELYSAGLIHGDIKPGNIFIDQHDNAKLGDLGLARPIRQIVPSRLQSGERIFGSPSYMAPEQLTGHSDIRSDIYALGATLYEMLGGRPPYLGEDPLAVAKQVLNQPPPALSTLRDDLAPEIVAFVDRLMHRDPNQRYQRPETAYDEVERLLGERAHHRSTITYRQEQRASGVATGPVIKADRQRLGTWAVIIVIVGGILIILTTRNGSNSAPNARIISTQRDRVAEDMPEPTSPTMTVREEPLATDGPTHRIAPAMPTVDLEAADTSPAGSPVPDPVDEPVDPLQPSIVSPSESAMPGADLPRGVQLGDDSFGPWLALAVAGEELRFRRVAAGRLTLPDERRVAISHDLWIAEQECPQRLYSALMGSNPACFTDPLAPVEQVSWHDAQEFCHRLASSCPEFTFRLPSEAEWLLALQRGGPALEDSHLLGGATTTQLGTRPAGIGAANRLGICDLVGNVAEWCLDGFAPRPVQPPDDYIAEPGFFQVVRGGSWIDEPGDHIPHRRDSFPADTTNNRIGFRILIDPASPGLKGLSTP